MKGFRFSKLEYTFRSLKKDVGFITFVQKFVNMSVFMSCSFGTDGRSNIPPEILIFSLS